MNIRKKLSDWMNQLNEKGLKPLLTLLKNKGIDFYEKKAAKYKPTILDTMKKLSIPDIQITKNIRWVLAGYGVLLLLLSLLGRFYFTHIVAISLLFLNFLFVAILFFSTRYAVKHQTDLLGKARNMAQKMVELKFEEMAVPENCDELEKNLVEISNAIRGIIKKSNLKIKKFTGLSGDLGNLVEDSSASQRKVIDKISQLAEISNVHAQAVKELEDFNKRIVDQLEFVTALNQKNYDSSADSVSVVLKGKVSIHDQDILMEKNISLSSSIKASIYELNKQIKVIENMTKSISTLAKESSFIAINAAIEAGKLSSHNGTIAVIASEMKKLSVSTADLSKSIITIINHIKSSSLKTTDAIDSFHQSLELQKESLKTSLQSYNHIELSARGISENVEQSKNSIGEITQMSKSISLKSSDVSDIAHDIAEKTTQLSSFSQSEIGAIGLIDVNLKNMKEQLDGLKEAISAVKIG